MAEEDPTKWRIRDRPERGILLWEIRKNHVCLNTFYDRTFSRAYSAVLETVLWFCFCLN